MFPRQVRTMAATLIYDPASKPMVYACGVSGSGTNYERIYERDPGIHHVVFTNAPGCSGAGKASKNGAPVAALILLSTSGRCGGSRKSRDTA